MLLNGRFFLWLRTSRLHYVESGSIIPFSAGVGWIPCLLTWTRRTRRFPGQVVLFEKFDDLREGVNALRADALHWITGVVGWVPKCMRKKLTLAKSMHSNKIPAGLWLLQVPLGQSESARRGGKQCPSHIQREVDGIPHAPDFLATV